ETFMVTTVPAYGIPLVSGHDQLQTYEQDTITKTAIAVVLFQAVAITAFLMTEARPKRTPLWRRNAVSGEITNYLGYGMFLAIAYSLVENFTDLIPDNLEGPIRAICFGIGIIATFVGCRRWGQGELQHYKKMGFAVQLAVLVASSLVSLFLVQAISTLLLALLGYVSGSKKFPLMATAILLPIFAILHQGKSTMREKYWDGGAPRPTAADLPAFFGEWINDGLATAPTGGPIVEKHTLLDRTSLIQIMCLVISVTPDKRPYLYGETYAQIPGQFVPRIFWPGKPVGHISTYTLAIYYGLQRVEDTQRTTIGFGLLAEAYANFGFGGVCIVAYVFGALFKKISGWASESPILSYPGMILIVLMAWSFQDELTLSIWLSSLWQACAVVCVVPFMLNKLSM
ncbi:MAG: O-antigen polysaccharide polymerase Wzy, partial [Opitutaceae bacterium]